MPLGPARAWADFAGEVWANGEGGELECQVVLSQTESHKTMKMNVLGCQN